MLQRPRCGSIDENLPHHRHATLGHLVEAMLVEAHGHHRLLHGGLLHGGLLHDIWHGMRHGLGGIGGGHGGKLAVRLGWRVPFVGGDTTAGPNLQDVAEEDHHNHDATSDGCADDAAILDSVVLLWVLVEAVVVGVARFVLFSLVALGAALGIKMLAARDARVCASLGQHGSGNNGEEERASEHVVPATAGCPRDDDDDVFYLFLQKHKLNTARGIC